jgi:primosomal protein N' (replication factor Y)
LKNDVSKECADVAVYLPLGRTFHYGFRPEDREKLKPGVRVVVPFRNRDLIGVFLGFTESDIKTKDIKSILDETPAFSKRLIELALWVSTYYISGPGEVFKAIGPSDELKRKSVVSRGKTERPPGSRKSRVDNLLEHLKKPITVQTLAGKEGITVSELEKTIKPFVRKGYLHREDEYYFAAQKTESLKWQDSVVYERPIESLNSDQRAAVDSITSVSAKEPGKTTLLFGVTGSGKTEIYIDLCLKAVEGGGCAIVLVPEIALTYQFVRRFHSRFGDKIAVFHSGLTLAQKRDEWIRARNGQAKVVIGARSAIFAPLDNLKLVVVDEEHDSSYKQSERPNYNARDVAVMIGKQAGATVVLGSATPSIESYYNATEGKYSLVTLKKRVDDKPLPRVTVEKSEPNEKKILPTAVVENIMSRLNKGEQSLVFINRRGASRHMRCSVCGECVECPNCSITLTHHTAGEHILVCHYCGYSLSKSPTCAKCSVGKTFVHKGIGTQSVENYLMELFPKSSVGRLDQDSAPGREKTFEILKKFEDGETDILVGTQMVAKGHDFENLTFTAIVGADDYLAFPDFRSSERTFSLITQASGRTGRGTKGGEVVISSVVDHYAIRHSVEHDYESFYKEEIETRKVIGYPPFSRLIGIRFESNSEETLKKGMNNLTADMPPLPQGVMVLGPVPSLIYKIRNRYRWKLLLKGKNSKQIHNASIDVSNRVDPRISISIDVDPVGFF